MYTKQNLFQWDSMIMDCNHRITTWKQYTKHPPCNSTDIIYIHLWVELRFKSHSTTIELYIKRRVRIRKSIAYEVVYRVDVKNKYSNKMEDDVLIDYLISCIKRETATNFNTKINHKIFLGY